MRCLALIAALALAAAAGGAVTLYAGWYDISATDQHLAHTYWLLDLGMKRSVKQRAEEIAVPPLDDPGLARRGFGHYKAHCEQCHGGPAVAPQPFALGLTPAPAMLAHTAREWQPAELFWVISEGIKMTGMPAWKYRLPQDDMWALVAFLRQLPSLSPAEYRALQPAPHRPSSDREAMQDPDAGRGKRAINQYLCVTCHRIPGIVGPNAPVGPPLEGIGTRAFIAGALPNTPENMVRWLRDPPRYDPRTAMPDLGVSERDARDIAAYLATLK
jgi:mono/diheme cytochrome c family protein